ncbi:MAG TPA: DUF2997 domain-containing protein [Patescibacteria group bacterium]|nr:DUF2997 domain-containing protein [Patescibacteria group bacterium]
MDMQELEIIIGADGKVSVKVAGAKGDQCLELTRPLEEALGQVEQREFTADYYQTTAMPQPQRTRDGK